MVEDRGSDVGIGDERCDAKAVTTARTFGDVVAKHAFEQGGPIEPASHLFIWLSYEHWSPYDWGGIRWDRIGNFVR